MRIFHDADTSSDAPDAKTFAGPARTKLLASADEGGQVRMYRVDFDSGARTNWHAHSGAQWLFVVAGEIRVQSWGQPAVDLGEGDAVAFSPGEKHWHGAVPNSQGTHLAVNINVTTEWMEAVSDAEYHRR